MAIEPVRLPWGPANTQMWGSAAPTLATDGTWEKGDVIWNNDPDAGEAFGWSCVVRGSPGTWKAIEGIAS